MTVVVTAHANLQPRYHVAVSVPNRKAYSHDALLSAFVTANKGSRGFCVEAVRDILHFDLVDMRILREICEWLATEGER